MASALRGVVIGHVLRRQPMSVWLKVPIAALITAALIGYTSFESERVAAAQKRGDEESKAHRPVRDTFFKRTKAEGRALVGKDPRVPTLVGEPSQEATA
jgi:hypothetical protein